MSTPPTKPDPNNNFTFFYPSPCSTSSADVAPPPSSSTRKLLLRRRQGQASALSHQQSPPASPPLPSIPSSPPSKPFVKLPPSDSAVNPASDSLAVPAETESSGYLDSIKIPSPLLYHRRSRELLTRSSDSDINAELTKTFLLNCGQDPPEPDFESYKAFDDTADEPASITNPEPTTTTDLQLSNTGLGERFPFYNIPWAPWIVPYVPQQTDVSLVSPSTVTTVQGTSARNSLSDATATAPVIAQRRPPSFGHEASVGVGTPVETSTCTKLVTRVETDQSRAASEFVDDDPFTLFKRWTAFEEAIRNPCKSETTVAQKSFLRSLTGAMAPIVREDPAACQTYTIPAPKCLALVPARLYRHQYMSWPRQLLYEPEYKKNLCYDFQSPVLQSFDTTDWLQSRKDTRPMPVCSSRRRAGHSVSEESVSSFDEDFKIPIEEDVATKAERDLFFDNGPTESLKEHEILEEEDEGYVTARETEAEVTYEEVLGSDNESWEDWTWSDDDLRGNGQG
jgi:hypothetical protein